MSEDPKKLIPGAPDKYANPYISDATYKGLSPENIDTLGALGRMMLIQDGCIKELLEDHHKAFEKRLEAFEIKVFKKIGDLETKIDNQVCVFDTFKKEEFVPLTEKLELISREVHSVKKKNTWPVIIARGLGWTTLGTIIIRILHGPFFD